jgi:hypothetical protein
MQRDAFGMPDLVPVVIDDLERREKRSRAEHAIPQCLRIWLGS